jgi:hypothetical protein
VTDLSILLIALACAFALAAYLVLCDRVRA